jgi:hypothetical protein
MTTAAPGGRRTASTNRLKCSVENLSPHCNLDAHPPEPATTLRPA